MRINYYFIFALISLSACGNHNTDINQDKADILIGNWSTHHVYIGEEDILGHANSLSYVVKPAIFTKTGRFSIILDLDTKESIKANYSLVNPKLVDSIRIFDSNYPELNGVYNIKFADSPDYKDILGLALESNKNFIYFERLTARLNIYD